MKKLLLLIPSLLLADKSEELLKAYQSKDWNKSYSLASNFCKYSCNDMELNLILGQSAYRLGLYDEALAAYDRVLVMDNNNIEARLQSAIIYQKSGNLELLKSELSTLIEEERLSNNDRQLVNLMLKQIRYKENKSYESNRAYASVGFGYGYDTNPKRLQTNDTIFVIPDLGIKLPITGEEYQPSTSLLYNLNAGYKKAVNEVYDFNLNTNFYTKYYIKKRKENFQNLSVFSPSLTNNFNFANRFRSSLMLSYDYVILKNKAYMNSFTADISTDFNVYDRFWSGLGYMIAHNNYIEEKNKENNVNHHSIYLMNKIFFTKSMLYVRLAYDIEQSSIIKNNLSNYEEYSISTGLIHMLNKQVTLSTGFSYAKDNYKEKFLSNKRNDTLYKANFSAEYNMDHHNYFSFNFSYDNTKSTVEINSYNNYSTNLIYKYKF